MSTFAQLLNKFRQDAFSERDKGYRFERLMQAYLKTTTLYANLFEEVWLWTEFPFHDQFGGKDTGIDLVARTVEGEYWAIQCKCYAANAFINKPDVDTFLSTSGKRFETESGMTGFVQRLWISTTNKWNSTAEQTIRNQNPPVTRLNLIDLENDDVDWNSLEQGIFGMASRSKPFAIREHQQQAIDQTHAYFKIDEATGQPAHTRGKLIMACGTGKTFTSLRIAENETGGRGLVLFLVPSIALLGQTLRSWLQQALEPMMAVCICSDPQVSKQTEKNDNDTTSVVDLALPASTDVPSIVKQLQHARRHNAEGLTVVFSTYQSIDVISRAQQQLLKVRPHHLRRGAPHHGRYAQGRDRERLCPGPQQRLPARRAPYLHDRHATPLYRRDEETRRGELRRPLLDGRPLDVRRRNLPHRLRRGRQTGAALRLQGPHPRRGRKGHYPHAAKGPDPRGRNHRRG